MIPNTIVQMHTPFEWSIDGTEIGDALERITNLTEPSVRLRKSEVCILDATPLKRI